MDFQCNTLSVFYLFTCGSTGSLSVCTGQRPATRIGRGRYRRRPSGHHGSGQGPHGAGAVGRTVGGDRRGGRGLVDGHH